MFTGSQLFYDQSMQASTFKMDIIRATSAPKPQEATIASQEEMLQESTAVEAAAPEPEAAVSARPSTAVKRMAIKSHATVSVSQAIPSSPPASSGSSARGRGLPPSQSHNNNPVLFRATPAYTGAARPSSYKTMGKSE